MKDYKTHGFLWLHWFRAMDEAGEFSGTWVQIYRPAGAGDPTSAILSFWFPRRGNATHEIVRVQWLPRGEPDPSLSLEWRPPLRLVPSPATKGTAS